MKQQLNCMISLLAAVTAACLLTACGGDDSSKADSGAGSLTFVDWGGTNTQARIDQNLKPFEEATGIKVTVVTPTDYAKLISMVESGSTEWDVVNCDAYWGVFAGNKGYLEPIDYGTVTVQIDPEVQLEYVMGAEVYASVISFNTNKYTAETCPQNWAEFYDLEKFPGKRAMWQYPVTVLESALLADGVPLDQLYPLDLDRAFAKLDTIKSSIVWWTKGAQPAQMLATSEADLALGWSGRIITASDEGSPVGLIYNQGMRIAAGWIVPKNAPHKENAMKFIQYVSTAEAQKAFSDQIPYGSTNPRASDLMDEEQQARIGQTPAQLANETYINNQYWAEHLAEVQERFNAWLLQ